MADSVADVAISGATWTNLYSETGITVGTSVTVYNKGSQDGVIAIKATAPSGSIGVPVFANGSSGDYVFVDGNPSGLWFYCPSPLGTILSVQA